MPKAIKKKKAVLTDAKANQRKRRQRRLKTAEEATGKASLDKMALKHKLEAVLSWHCNGYVLDGARLGQDSFAKKIGVTLGQLDKMVKQIQSNFTERFENSDNAKQQVYNTASTLLHQIREERARAMIHADQLDDLMQHFVKELKSVMELSEAQFTETAPKRSKIAMCMGHIKTLSALRGDSLRVMAQTSRALREFLMLFTDEKKGSLAIPNIHVEVHQNNEQQPVCYVDAIRIIESKFTSNLPTQDTQLINQGPRNPNHGFEELEGHHDAKN
nr:hypothetical protein 14 [bacterium]